MQQHGVNATFISLTPAASHSLDCSHVPYRNLRSYAAGGDIYHTGLDNFRRLEKLFQVLDPDLKDLHGIPTLHPARYTVWNLKFLFDSVYSMIAIVSRIIDAEGPDFICFPFQRTPDQKKRQDAFNNEESVFPAILSSDGWKVPIKWLEKGESPPRTLVENSWPSRLEVAFRHWMRSHNSLMNIGLMVKRDNFLAASRGYLMSLGKRSGGPVLIYGNGYNWDDSLTELYHKGWRPIWRIHDETTGRPTAPSNHYQASVLEFYKSHQELRDFDRFLSIDIAPFLSGRISEIISDSIVESIESYHRTRNLIEEKGIRALLISVRNRPAGHAAVQAARDAGIPVISWQHGGAGYSFHPMMPYIECVNTDLHLVFGPPVAESYRTDVEWLGWQQKPGFIPVGSSSLDLMKAKLSKSKAEPEGDPVLYITTHYQHNFFIISQHEDPVGYDEHLWEVQKRVIDLAGRFPGRKFIVKLHPTHISGEPLVSYTRDSGIRNIRFISHEASTEDLLRNSSAVIFDLISTGILQALLTKRPIFAYTGLSQFDETARNLLKKRAVVSSVLDEFIGSVAKYLDGDTGNTESLSNSLDFIKAYGLHEADGMSAKRAVALLGEIAKDTPY